MGKKKSKNNGGGETKNNDSAEKKSGSDGAAEKKEENPITVVLKIDFHCEGCGTKIVKTVRSFQGVESVKPESEANKLTVVGKVDPTKLKDKLAAKMKKKVDLISPQPKKDDAAKKQAEKTNDENKKTKEPPVTTAVMKLNWHCQGCVQKIQKMVSKTKGFHDMSIDKDKDLLTVKGSMDMKELAENLKSKLKRPVDIVPPKKEKEKAKDGGENGGGGNQKVQEPGGGGGAKIEGQQRVMEYPMGQPGYGNVPYGMVYGPGYGGYGYPIPPPPMPVYTGNPLHAPQIFSDENPNACSIM